MGTARLGLLSLIASLVVWAAACDDGSDGSVANIEGLDAFDAMEYFDVLEELQRSASDEVALPDDEAEWRSLVRHQRELGLEALTSDEREALLTGAALAYLSLVESASFQYESPQGKAEAQEVYASETTTGLFLELRRRRAVLDGMEVEWGGVPLIYDDIPGETRQFIDPPDGDVLTGEQWERRGSEWHCSAWDSDDGYAFAQLVYVGTAGPRGSGSPAGRETVAGRETEVVEVVWGSGDSTRRGNWWLDVQTLWPVKWELEGRLPEGGTMKLTTRLTAINQPFDIERPGVECAAASAER